MWWSNWRIYFGGGGNNGGGGHGGTVTSVPEIDASSGALALAVVVAATLLTWELRRRKSA